MIANNVSTISKQNAEGQSGGASSLRIPALAAHSSSEGNIGDLDTVVEGIAKTGSFLAAATSTGPVIPALGAVAVALAYGMDPDWWPYNITFGQTAMPIKHYPIFGGTLFVVVAWLIYVAFVYANRRTAANTANSHEFNTLYTRARQAAAHVAILAKTRPGLTGADGAPGESECARFAYEDAFGSCEDIAIKLRRPSMEWVMATGYVNMWIVLHNGEQALIEIVPLGMVIRDAEYDRERLTGSTIDNSAAWLVKLNEALDSLYPLAQNSAASALLQPPSNGNGNTAAGSATEAAPAGAIQVHPLPQAPAQPAAHPSSQPRTQAKNDDAGQSRVYTETLARADVRNIRRVIDEFRDDRRDKLVRATNHLKASVFVTGLAAYVLLDAAIGFDAHGAMVPGASATAMHAIHTAFQQGVRGVLVIFLVGVIVGFIGRLNVDTGADAASEDYGLSATRLRQIPVFSGLAAIGGVLLAGLVTGKGVPNELVNVLKPDIGILITAAIFGLTPGLLIDRLQQQTTEQYKRDLKSTDPTVQTGRPRA